SETPAADVLVTIEPRAERRLGVVQMERQYAATPHRGLALGHRTVVSGLGAEIVAGGEKMARVETDAQALRSSGALEQGRELAERPADRISRSRGVLERDLHAVARGARQRFVECGGDPSEPGLQAGAHVRAGMDDDAREPERFGTLELVRERGDRL